MGNDARPDDQKRLQAAAVNLKASGGLGHSGLLIDLFDYLVKTTLEGRSPKENEIAIEVFGRAPDFNPTEDATIRVSVHRLRKKIAEAYTRGDISGPKIILPRGEYRLELAEPEPSSVSARMRGSPFMPWIAAVVVCALLIAVALSITRSAQKDRWAEIRESGIWREVVHSPRPTSVVLGDYVIKRPYQDRGTLLIPAATGSALQKLLPLLESAESRWGGARVISASETTPDRIKLSNVVYVGPLDAMGEMAAPWQLASHLHPAGQDEWRIEGSRTALRRDRSEIDVASGSHRDFAYIAALPGPNDTRIVIISGFDGAGIAQAAEIATTPQSIAEIARRVGKARDFEVVYDVRAMGNTNVGAALLYARPINAAGMWLGHDPDENGAGSRATSSGARSER